MFGIADYGAFCASILVFLALSAPGTMTLHASTGERGLRVDVVATSVWVVDHKILLWLAVADLRLVGD